jgi:16S rRNA (uracil1498-N3)-methyltransferase
MSSLYLDESLPAGTVDVGDLLSVTGNEARHAVTISRVRVGERVAIGNGAGLIAWGMVASATAAELTITVEMVGESDPPVPRLGLVQALAKGDRDEMAVQAATELGVDSILPWAAARSVSRWEGARQARGRERWQAIAREASKQSIRATVPTVGMIATTKSLCALAGTDCVLVLDPNSPRPLTGVDLPTSGTIWVLAGPEGGISEDELTSLETAGAHRVSLGTGILRTSTAGPAAIAVLNAQLGRW